MRPRASIFGLLGAGFSAIACGPTVPVDAMGSGDGTGGMQDTSSPGASNESTSEDGPPIVCEPDATLCDGSEYGTWRLSSAEADVAAYLYLWPSAADGTTQLVSRWFVDDEAQEHCTRNGRYVSSGDLASMLTLKSDGLGGTNIELCGGDPSEHELTLELTRVPNCSGEVLALTVIDTNGASLYSIEGTAVHCGCETGYDPYSGLGEPLPTTSCLSP